MTAHCRVEMIIIRILNFNIIAQRTSVGKSCKIDFLYSVGFQTSIRLNKMVMIFYGFLFCCCIIEKLLSCDKITTDACCDNTRGKCLTWLMNGKQLFQFITDIYMTDVLFR